MPGHSELTDLRKGLRCFSGVWFGDTQGKEKVAAEDEMVREHHQLNGHEFEQTPGDSGGQRSLMRCSPWGHKESDTIERLN